LGATHKRLPHDRRGALHLSCPSLSMVARNLRNAKGPDIAATGLGLDLLLIREHGEL
jgi:Glycosyl transferase family 2